jgi:hypothetical protein
MVNWRSALALGAAVLLVCSAPLLAQEKKLNDAQKKDFQAIVKMVDGPATGQPASNDIGLTWVQNDLLKAAGNMQFVPFTVSVDTSKLATKTMSLYWRVVSKNPPAEGDKKKKKGYAYEDLASVPLEGASGVTNISRSFTVPGGSYELVIVAKDAASKEKNAPAPKIAMIRQPLEIPDFWNGEFTTSTLIVAKAIEPLSAPLTPDQQADRPYAMGAVEIVPALTSKFTKQSELSTFMLIYNAQVDAANKPDVTVEYNFYVKQAGAEKFFNKTNPQALNAQTLPAGFDFAAGHQLQTGQAIPLGSFPEGDYRLEIKVTDKLSSKSLMRELSFSVSGS